MTAKSFARMTLLASALALSVPAFAAEPTIHEVYLAAEAGKFTEAQAMMDQVLKAHPNSATAHFVEAELLAKQGKFVQAQAELARAEQIAPGLPKVDPKALSKLRTLLVEGQKPATSYSQQTPRNNAGYSNSNYGAPKSSGIPWGTVLILGAGLLGFIWLATRFMAKRNQEAQGYQPGAAYNPGAPAPGYAPGAAYPQQGYPQQGYGQPQQGPTMGSRIMGGLATGAAVGAGIVAGEALARQFTGGSHDNASSQPRNDIVYDDPARDELLRRDDMGGNDFGTSGGWDDGGSSGGDSGGGDWD
ncbi:tetratricopeptide repeat protein [Pseudoduganella danionis]|uniref:Tetratricopeptide repeat protein n=1 Tax=Pseudoduganella danionis TaxID=1890295 RepID=A0ABW9SQB2_9BURK|nr:tetratricopeptide repeat protein [Pseudoduganella danionis]MTW33830.1 tetratricopeptide repeat protein [Pseudoduganella danionis]